MSAPEAPGWSPSDRELERRRVRARLSRRRVAAASLATVVVIGGLAAVVLLSPGWPRVRESFFDGFHARESLPAIVDGFWINVKMFLIAEPLILVLGLALAIVRSSRSPWLVPVRGLAVVYTDVVRGVPTLLLVFLFAFGMPALELQGVPDSSFFWATVALVISYSAYVAEVFRSGIESVHPSQVLSAEALALSRGQTMRHVVVPQAVRRVVPPLLNDFVSLQKDTALVASVSIFDALFTARDYANFNFNYTPYVVVACFFVAMTVPLARLCDWLAARVARRERAGVL
ncbi:amino acid ABC transporter permease [Nocardioides pelophilus]|uniref:amino acid ABC transporter permease n=1 Tax=Nocardioides pelophilus TaxID=2172019 RepID=UPI0028AD087D|nr:amino acid ABC transporter permease [Nocardioides pelophilus]